MGKEIEVNNLEEMCDLMCDNRLPEEGKKIGLLKDRPCEACIYHKENGCSRWSCEFER